ELYSAADFAVARSGAASLAELAAFALPAILIPFPYAADDHQARNAEVFVKADAAILVKESEILDDALAREILPFIEDHGRLQRLGLQFFQQHRAENAAEAELIVYSSAIRADNPILVSARQSETRTARRAEALAAIMQGKRGIIICGMHGKTTTSAMTAHVLREGGLHPSHYVGAEIPILGQNAHWDPRGEFFVAEGDESDGTIRCFHP